MRRSSLLFLVVAVTACGLPALEDTSGAGGTGTQSGVGEAASTATTSSPEESSGTAVALAPVWDPVHFAVEVVSFAPGEAAGFGQQNFPEMVLGPPKGKGANGGSLDVLSLGKAGSIILGFARDIVDIDGPDLIVFENAFVAGDGSLWAETAIVGVSEDGKTFVDWPCAADDTAGGWPGCAGVHPTLATDENGLSPFDPAVSGGDMFDLAAIGLSRARYVRIVDSGLNTYAGTSGGFDLDAVAAVAVASP